jgi:hypothetical protein
MMQSIKDISFHQTFMQLFLKFFFDHAGWRPRPIHWSTKVKKLFGKVVGNTLVDKRNGKNIIKVSADFSGLNNRRQELKSRRVPIGTLVDKTGCSEPLVASA